MTLQNRKVLGLAVGAALTLGLAACGSNTAAPATAAAESMHAAAENKDPAKAETAAGTEQTASVPDAAEPEQAAAQNTAEEESFVPALDTETEASVTVAGSYNNFEALEAIFDRFNEYYPNVELSFVKLDDYNNNISTALQGDNAPDIYSAFAWMVGREQYQAVFDKAENLADPNLHLQLDCIREGLIYRDEEGSVPMVPIFSTTYGMLVNEDLFQKEGIEIPVTYQDFLKACEDFKSAGYPMPILGFNRALYIYGATGIPFFCYQMKNDPEGMRKLDAMEPGSGEYLRSMLELAEDLREHGIPDTEASARELEDDYNSVIMRFFEGDIPMMLGSGDTASGTLKRESQSEAFMAAPFTYSFHPVPMTEEGGFFFNPSGIQFSVNKESSSLEMANEFMRFLVSTGELNEMARIKRLVTPTKDLSFDGVYAAFGEVKKDHVLYPQEIGLTDEVEKQLRAACWNVGTGVMTVDEAVEAYGTLE